MLAVNSGMTTDRPGEEIQGDVENNEIMTNRFD
jgi:hypothetical protein